MISIEDKNTLREWLQPSGVRYFKHLYGLFGTVSPVMRLNQKKRLIPAHAVHFNEGMLIRNFMRKLSSCKDWTQHQLDDNWADVVLDVINN